MTTRVVFDTNVVISGFLWKGAPYCVLKAASSGLMRAFSSIPMLEELERTLSSPKFSRFFIGDRNSPEELRKTYESFVDIVVPETVGTTLVAAHPSDDIVVTTAMAADAEYIISGNKHLLNLPHSFRFQVITPAQFAGKI